MSFWKIWLLSALTSKFISSCSELTFHLSILKRLKRFPTEKSQSYVSASLLCHWSIFSCVHPSLDAGKIHSDFHVEGGFRNYFQDHRRLRTVFTVIGGFLNAAISSLCLWGGSLKTFFWIWKFFHRFDYLNNEAGDIQLVTQSLSVASEPCMMLSLWIMNNKFNIASTRITSAYVVSQFIWLDKIS